jgi:NAD(P)-dependent dehydrogenase (short-subunit alcohol dehydrogenase family)
MTIGSPGENDDVPSYPALLDLTDRMCVVLGAGQGMGRQSAHALAQAGATVACVDQDPQLAASIADAVGGISLTADVTKSAEVERVFDEVASTLGAVHGVVDIVGVASAGPITSVEEATWDWQFDIVVRHAFHTIRHAAPHLAKVENGSMVFIGSLSGVVGIPGQGVYGAAKAALHHLVRTAALELGPSGTRANVVAPGFVATPRLKERFPPSAWDAIAAVTPNRRVADPSDIAAVVLFLTSGMSQHMTGQVLSVDGGVSSLVGFPPLEELIRPGSGSR